MSRKFVVAGGSGFIGRALVDFWSSAGEEVVVLSRAATPVKGARSVAWPEGDWASELEGADAVVNLSGNPISKKHTAAYRTKIEESRIGPTTALAEAIKKAEKPSKVWINASGVGFYGDRGGDLLSESSRAGDDFLAQLCVKWEAACLNSGTPRTRKVTPRLGVVLGEGGAFAELKKLPTGGIGSGKQYVSWIHIHDLVRFIDWLTTADVQGPINAVAPGVVTNKEFMTVLHDEMGLPNPPPMPDPVFRAIASLMGLEASVALVSMRVDPRLALVHGFDFDYPTLRPALQNLLDNVPPAWRKETQL